MHFFLNWFYAEKKCAVILKETGVLKVEVHSHSVCDFCDILMGVTWIGYPMGRYTETERLDLVSSTFATSSYIIWYHWEKIQNTLQSIYNMSPCEGFKYFICLRLQDLANAFWLYWSWTIEKKYCNFSIWIFYITSHFLIIWYSKQVVYIISTLLWRKLGEDQIGIRHLSVGSFYKFLRTTWDRVITAPFGNSVDQLGM